MQTLIRYEPTEFDLRAVERPILNKPCGRPSINDRRVLKSIFGILRPGSLWRVCRNAMFCARSGITASGAGRGRACINTKIYCMVDNYGRPLKLFVTPGQTHDNPAAIGMLGDIRKGAAVREDRGPMFCSIWPVEPTSRQTSTAHHKTVSHTSPINCATSAKTFLTKLNIVAA